MQGTDGFAYAATTYSSTSLRDWTPAGGAWNMTDEGFWTVNNSMSNVSVSMFDSTNLVFTCVLEQQFDKFSMDFSIFTKYKATIGSRKIDATEQTAEAFGSGDTEYELTEPQYDFAPVTEADYSVQPLEYNTFDVDITTIDPTLKGFGYQSV